MLHRLTGIKRVGLLVLATIIATATMAACSTDDPAEPSGAGGAAGGGARTLTFALGSTPISLDVTKHFDGTVMGIMSLFTEPLERLASDGSMSANLATSVSQPDDETIVYTLRPDVKFSNGEPMTADDVVWSIKHVSDAEAGAQTASIVQNVADVSATGKNEVTVTLKAPDPTLRGSLALVSLVQDADYAKDHAKDLGTPAAVPVGTGPYRVVEFTTESISLERNPYYWGDQPAADSIEIVFINSDNSAQLAMRSGEIQGAMVGDATTVQQWEGISGTTTYSSPMLLSAFLCLDTTVAPFDDIHVRTAIAHAIDRDGLLQAAFGGNAALLTGLTPPAELSSVAPSTEAAEAFLSGLPAYDFDMETAKAELAESSHPDGFSVTIPYVDGLPWSKLTVLNLQENLKPLGVTITPKTMTTQEWTAALFAHKTTPVWPMAFAAAIPDPGLLGRLITKEAITAPGGYNFAKWAPKGLQEAAATLTGSTDKAARWEAAQQVLTQIADEVPYIPLFQPQLTIVLGDGYEFTETPGLMELASGTWIHELTIA